MQYTEIEPGYFVSTTLVKQLQSFGYIVYGKINHGAFKDQKCVVKVLFPPQDEEDGKHQRREVEVTQNMNHRNIIRTYKILEKDNKIYLFKEYENYKTFASIHQSLKGSPLGDNLTLEFAAQLIHCLAYLASQQIMNRDISLHNLLLTNDLTPKLFDFGQSKIEESFQIEQSAFVGGNDYFMSPQNLQLDPDVDQIDFEKNDVWALGMTLFVLNEVEFPWFKQLRPDDSDAFEAELERIRQQGITFRKTRNPELQDIIRRMLQYNQNQRPNFKELSAIPTIKNLLQNHTVREQQLFEKGQLFIKFKEISTQIKVSEAIQEIIYNKLIRDFTVDRDYVNIGTELHGIYKELLEKQILWKKKLLTEFHLKQLVRETFQNFLRRQIQNDPTLAQEQELIRIILQLQGIQITGELINVLRKQCEVA